MKKLIFTVVFLLLISSGVVADFEAKKFKTVFTITFDALTLEEASRIEDIINRKFKDACQIDVEVGEGGDRADDAITEFNMKGWE